MKPVKTLLTLLFFAAAFVISTPVVANASITFNNYPGGLTIATCNSPDDIFSPNNPLGVENDMTKPERSAGLFCLTGISFKLLYNAIILFGIAFFVILLIGGLRYLTAGGDEKSMQTARKTLTYGVMGMGIAVGSVFIMIVIMGNVLKPMETQFDPAHPNDVIAKPGTLDPFHVLIPDYFCTREGITDPSVIKNYCGSK